MGKDQEDQTGMTPMREAAVGLHEMYIELKAAGFSRNETMELMARVMAQTFGIQNENETGG